MHLLVTYPSSTRWTQANHGGETILLYRIDENNYILVDTHVTTGFMLISNIDIWLTTLYLRYNGADAPAIAWFAPELQ